MAAQRQPEGTKRRPTIVLVRCIECEYSDCVRWNSNPVISICSTRRSFGQPYRMVANTEHQCELFKRFNGIVKNIKQL